MSAFECVEVKEDEVASAAEREVRVWVSVLTGQATQREAAEKYNECAGGLAAEEADLQRFWVPETMRVEV